MPNPSIYKSIAAAVLTIALSAAAGPKLSMMECVDIGSVEVGSSAERRVPIANTGDEKLQLTGITACCGIKAFVDSPDIAPGTNAILTVSVASFAPKTVNKRIMVFSNDPTNKLTYLRVTGRIIPKASNE